MAVIDRRTFADIKAEHIDAMGRFSDSDYGAAAGRAERHIEAAYYYICTEWHHYELDVVDKTIVLSTSSNSVDIAALNPYVVRHVAKLDGNDVFEKELTYEESAFLFSRFRPESETPSKWTRVENDLYFDTIPDAAEKLQIMLYKFPAAPDFATGGGAVEPAIGRAWDQAILDLSLALAHEKLWRGDVAAVHRGSFDAFTAITPQPRLIDVIQRPRPQVSKRDASHGGAQ